MSWEEAWREGRARWDMGRSPPELDALVRAGDLPTGRALVPGCGAGYDVLTLASDERVVIGLDVAPTAEARFSALRTPKGIAEDRARVIVADFFAYEPEEPFDLIWDYTFLCAIDPSARPAWVDRMDALLAPDGELVTLVFPATETPPHGVGPPFALPPREVRALLEPRFVATRFEPVKESHPRRDGMEWIGRWRKR